jgi:hypothetical protein
VVAHFLSTVLATTGASIVTLIGAKEEMITVVGHETPNLYDGLVL